MKNANTCATEAGQEWGVAKSFSLEIEKALVYRDIGSWTSRPSESYHIPHKMFTQLPHPGVKTGV